MIMLRSLELRGMAQAVDDLVAQETPAFEAAKKVNGDARIYQDMTADKL